MGGLTPVQLEDLDKYVDVAVAKHTYNSSDPKCINLSKGDMIFVIKTDPSGWWNGICKMRKGWFPSNFVRSVREKIISGEIPCPEIPDLIQFQTQTTQTDIKTASTLVMHTKTLTELDESSGQGSKSRSNNIAGNLQNAPTLIGGSIPMQNAPTLVGETIAMSNGRTPNRTNVPMPTTGMSSHSSQVAIGPATKVIGKLSASGLENAVTIVSEPIKMNNQPIEDNYAFQPPQLALPSFPAMTPSKGNYMTTSQPALNMMPSNPNQSGYSIAITPRSANVNTSTSNMLTPQQSMTNLNNPSLKRAGAGNVSGHSLAHPISPPMVPPVPMPKYTQAPRPSPVGGSPHRREKKSGCVVM